MNLNELRQKRGNNVKLARDIHALAETENRALTQDEQNRWDALMAEVDSLGDTITREERMADLERELNQSQGREAPPADPNPGAPSERRHPRDTDEYRAAFGRFLRGGMSALSGDEVRALQADVDPSGGYLVASHEFSSELIKAVDNLTFIRGLATVTTVAKAEALGAVTLDADPDDADWTTELATGNEDNAMAFGLRELRPHPLAKRIKVSRKLLRAATMGVEQLVRERLAYKFAITQEKAFLTGTGAQQPLGLFTASAQGIPTSRDVSTANTTTAITADGLINAKYALKSQYYSSLRWLFHRDAIKEIRKLKDGNNQYIWQPGLQAGVPDRILDVPFLMSEYVPNTFTTGLYVGMIADFSKYWIADALDMEVQRLDELYAVTNQVGFIGRLETDGMPVLAEAFVRVTLA